VSRDADRVDRAVIVRERALAESEARYRFLVDNLNDVVFQSDAAGRWTFLNPAWTRITGFSAEESLGQIFLNFVYPEDRERNAEKFKPLIERQKETCRHEVRYRRKGGGFVWLEVFARLCSCASS
jgi:PAS domain S-box-containing protein